MTDSPGAPSSEGLNPRLTRRRFLVAAAGVGAVAVAGGAGASLAGLGARPGLAADATSAAGPSIIPFDGAHQAGITRPATPQPASLLAAFDVVAPDRDGLAGALRELTARSRLLAAAWSPDAGDQLYPPPESGVVGASTGPADLTVTVSVGASLFDDRFGLAGIRPRQLEPMPTFPNDVLAPDLSHGDLLVQVCAVDRLAVIHALRYLQLGVRDAIRLRWLVEGFQRPDPVAVPGHTTTRNLLGFKDGTANLPAADDALMDDLVWVGAADGEPDWAVGGSYLAVRIIRMFVERWDRTALSEQEAIIGRAKRVGAPLGSGREEDVPDYAADPSGAVIPLDAHIRLANPRTPGSERSRILRRGYSFSRGFDTAGLLDQGLLFIAYQRSLAAGFLTVQARLNGEPLEEYIRPVGGGFFFALPGVRDPGGFLGEGLVSAG
jgi:deferrochelatase/peroxidase EfeB